MKEKEIKDFVKERYSKIANKTDSSSCSCCSGTEMDGIIMQAKAVGYSDEEIKSIPADAIFGLGCGNPTALAEIKKGETVLDLGSGGGIDVFLAANKVGDAGKVIGVDMTQEMVKTATQNAEAGGYDNVEFKLGEIENLPIEDNSIDVIISNCVINLTPNKSVAFKEVFRVLKDGGRILISDIVTEGELPDAVRKSFQAWSECTAGAMEKQDYLETIKKAGFKDVEIIKQHFFTEPKLDERLVGKITSVQVRALKEETVSDDKTACCGESIVGAPEKETDMNLGCCGETGDMKPESEIGESDECGCGGEFPDESLVKNPDEPKNMVDPDLLKGFEKFAHAMGIVSIGYTKVIPELINAEEPLYPNAIVLTLEMGEDIIETPPGPEAQQLNDATYAKLGNITYALSDFIRANGFVTQVAHPYGGMVGFSQLGQKAGLGWIGQSGLLISPELGPRQKISAIFTNIENLPLNNNVDHSWISDYCGKCGKCIKACPEKALIETKSCCGKEIEFIQKRCIGCSQGCTYCIGDCPFDEKGYEHVKNKFDKMNAKLTLKKSKSGC
ncbi:arsenite methyltransferase [Methanobacterium formicicum]|uniref:Arsenite methyltransferase n=1 Tax=Methanobacterium formicicum (strain DSM 3637 / PP1) TaxID=1204725 RepID=K2RCZ0_METFP|nr:arsenite methyltransferase [Methanobacterium formicicum]EKF86204.1 type 11 methyltransferase [Methanobacterium formicicum DSM 3637]